MEDRDLRGYVAELLGTFVFVLLTACAVSANVRGALEPWMVVVVALTAGAGYAAALAFTLPHSSGFLNPAMPIALWVFRQLDGVRALGYIFVQIVGALLAGGVVRALFSFPEWVSRGNHLGTPHLVEDTLGADPLGMRVKGIAIELLLSYAVALTIFGTVVRRRALGKSIQLSPLWIGLALAAATLAGFPMTGAGLNPARWFGSAIWELTLINTNAFSDHVAFWVGPIGGSLAAAWSYNVFLRPAEVAVGHTTAVEP
jgi:glycerol uptake facilitator-like aquaporin